MKPIISLQKWVASLPGQLNIHKRTLFQAYPGEFLEKYDLRDAVVFSLMGLFHLFRELQLKANMCSSKNYPTPYIRFCSLLFGIFRGEESEDDVGKAEWRNYDYRGASQFAQVSNLLKFDFLFAREIYDQEATKSEILKLDDILNAVSPLLAPYRLGIRDHGVEDLSANHKGG